MNALKIAAVITVGFLITVAVSMAVMYAVAVHVFGAYVTGFSLDSVMYADSESDILLSLLVSIVPMLVCLFGTFYVVEKVES